MWLFEGMQTKDGTMPNHTGNHCVKMMSSKPIEVKHDLSFMADFHAVKTDVMGASEGANPLGTRNALLQRSDMDCPDDDLEHEL